MRDARNGQREPMFNLPPVIVVFVFLAAAIFIGQSYYLSEGARLTFLETFCFSPLRYRMLADGVGVSGGWAAAVWTPLTYVFIERGLGSLVFNLLWLTAFGSAVAFRFGAVRFLAFSTLAAVIGAGLFTLVFGASRDILYGPNFVVAALLGAAIRFMYGGGLASVLASGEERWNAPALGLVEMWSNVGVLQLFGFIFAANALFSLLYASSGIDARALIFNMLGYAVGILLFSLFDRRRH